MAGAATTTAPLLSEWRPKSAQGAAACPGCIQERKNQLQEGIPYKTFLHIWAVTLAGALPVSSLFPYVYFMIRDFNIAKREEDIGFYAGFVGASFLVGRTLTSTLWGILADRHGRKPVVVFGVASVVIFNTMFGFSVNYWMALVTRFLLGALNGLLIPIRAYAVEVCRAEYKAHALALVSSAWAVGLIIGPAIGGYLALPAEKYPGVFTKDSLFGRFPYLLASIPITIFAMLTLISCISLQETLHNHRFGSEGMDIEAVTDDSKISVERNTKESNAKHSLFKNWPLMSSIILYCLFSLHDMAYSEIFPLWAESDRKFGGLHFSSKDVGQVLSVTGVGLLVYQLFIYHRVDRLLGRMNLCRLAIVLTFPLLSCYPLMTYLSGLQLTIAINIASLMKTIFMGSMITTTFVLQNDAVSQEQRGAANGISMTGASIFRAIGPAVGGALLSWAQKHVHDMLIPGDQVVFLVLNVMLGAALIWTFKPFLVLPPQESPDDCTPASKP